MSCKTALLLDEKELYTVLKALYAYDGIASKDELFQYVKHTTLNHAKLERRKEGKL